MVMTVRVLLVEDDIATEEASLVLRSAGFMVDYTDTGHEALKMARRYDYDLILLDLMLPDIEGYEVIRRMRAAHKSTPLIVLSAQCRPQDKVKAFAIGADDFVAKPFDRAELVARMQALLRRSKGGGKPGLQLSPDNREVSVDGRPVRLTDKEYAILELLMQRGEHGAGQGRPSRPTRWRHPRVGDEDHGRARL
jgi:two-component system cell cycle response regulator CtrA